MHRAESVDEYIAEHPEWATALAKLRKILNATELEDGRVDIYLVAVSPDQGSMVTMVLETHSVGVDLGRWYGPASLFIADKTQIESDDGLEFRFAKRL